MWFEPLKTFNRIFEEGMVVASEGRNFEKGENNYFYYFEAVYWTNNPLILLLFFSGLFLFFVNFKRHNSKQIFIFISFLSIIFFYFLQMTLVVQKIDRYISVIIPYITIFAVYTLNYLRINFRILAILILTISVVYISYFTPYYLALYEKDNLGSLTKEFADYLNSEKKILIT